ncbi:hypothetical protein M3J09_013784 [Ascochyta lentis]
MLRQQTGRLVEARGHHSQFLLRLLQGPKPFAELAL